MSGGLVPTGGEAVAGGGTALADSVAEEAGAGSVTATPGVGESGSGAEPAASAGAGTAPGAEADPAAAAAGVPVAGVPATDLATDPAAGSGGETAAAPDTDADGESAGSAGGGTPAGTERPAPGTVAWKRAHLDRSEGRLPAEVVTAYYVDLLSPDTVLQPVEVLVPHSATPLRTRLNLLLAPPEELSLTSGIPPGTGLREAGLTLQPDGTLVVDLTAELYRGSGSAWANAVTHTLVYTLTEHPEVQRVLLQVEGEPAELEGRRWDRALGRAELADRGLYQVAPLIRFLFD